MNMFSHRSRKIKISFLLLSAIIIFLFLLPGCMSQFQSNMDLQATMVSLGVQQTGVARTSQAFSQLVTSRASYTESNPVPSLNSPLPDPSLGTVEPPGESQVSTQVIPNPDERLMKSAKILLFEDMSASRYIRLVKEALDEADYFYVDVGSARGWFKDQLHSNQDWDLIIAAGEAERGFGGEFYRYLNDWLDKGAAVIIENWDLDSAFSGQVKPLLDRCGIEFQSDWYEPDLRVFFWLDRSHPIFNQPNNVSENIGTSQPIWFGDHGDLMQIRQYQQNGDALMLAGTNPEWKVDHATLATCVGGRLIIQTFRSHEYPSMEMVKLWQNYIYQALKHHFAYTQASIPTPQITVLPTVEAALTPPGPTPGPEYIFDHTCGGLLAARLVDAPQLQKDLFEHHAEGLFLTLKLHLENLSNFTIQILDGDYQLQGNIGSRQVTYSPHRAATGQLYLDNSTNLYQDVILPGESWTTSLAFDIAPEGKDHVLVVSPGNEMGQQVCQVRISVER